MSRMKWIAFGLTLAIRSAVTASWATGSYFEKASRTFGLWDAMNNARFVSSIIDMAKDGDHEDMMKALTFSKEYWENSMSSPTRWPA